MKSLKIVNYLVVIAILIIALLTDWTHQKWILPLIIMISLASTFLVNRRLRIIISIILLLLLVFSAVFA